MQQRSIWMRPALQTGEAVLLPALERRTRFAEPRFSDRYTRWKTTEDPFRPMPSEGQPQTLAISTYVRPRGSMAGRGVLRAAGISVDPFAMGGRRRYAAGAGRAYPARGSRYMR